MSKQQKRNKNEEERINRCIKMVNENRIEELTQIKHLQKKLKSNLTPEARLHYNKDPDMGQIKSPSLWTHFVSLSVLYPLSLLPCQPYRCRSIHPLPFIRGRVAVAEVFSYNVNRAVDPDQSTKHHEASTCPHRFNLTTVGMQRHTARCKTISNQYSKKRVRSAQKFMKLKFIKR